MRMCSTISTVSCGYLEWRVSLPSETRIPWRWCSVLYTWPETFWSPLHHRQAPLGPESQPECAAVALCCALKCCVTDWAAASPPCRSPRSPAPCPEPAAAPSCCAQAGAGPPAANPENTGHFSRIWKFSPEPLRPPWKLISEREWAPVSSCTRTSKAVAQWPSPDVPAGTARLCWGCCRGCSPALRPPALCTHSTTWRLSVCPTDYELDLANIIFFIDQTWGTKNIRPVNIFKIKARQHSSRWLCEIDRGCQPYWSKIIWQYGQTLQSILTSSVNHSVHIQLWLLYTLWPDLLYLLNIHNL